MARSAKQAEIDFEKRWRVQIEERLQIRVVREVLEKIRREAQERWEQGLPNELVWNLQKDPSGKIRVENPVSNEAEPFWKEKAICAQNGLHVQIRDRESEPPIIRVTLDFESELEDLAARPLYPQDLLSPGQCELWSTLPKRPGRKEEGQQLKPLATKPAGYDIWLIKRDAPLTHVLEDVRCQWKEFRADREEEASSRRGTSTDRDLKAIEVYRRRLLGQTFQGIAREFQISDRTAKRLVSDLCNRTGLAKPEKGTVLPDAPDPRDCDKCTKRPSPYIPCDDCPFASWVEFRLSEEVAQQDKLIVDDIEKYADQEDLGHRRKLPLESEY